MWNYYQITAEADERRQCILAAAEQRRITQLVPAQPRAIRVWLGQRLIQWGQQLQTQPSQLMHPTTPTALIR